MNEPGSVLRGQEVLREVLEKHTTDLRRLDLEGFRRWLEERLKRWQADPVFQQLVAIRELRRSNPQIISLEQELRAAKMADEESDVYSHLLSVERDLKGTKKAISGLTQALEEADPEERVRLTRKLQTFERRQVDLEEKLAQLTTASPERQARVRLEAALQQLKAAFGLDQMEARLAALKRERGHTYGRSGMSFETLAHTLTTKYILPDLVDRGQGRTYEDVTVLTGVTLKAAHTELDQVVVRMAPASDQPLEVLAVAEVKRNINDLAHGFRMRQENLAWLTGRKDHYDPEAYRNKYYPSGHFDQAVHEQDGMAFRFTRDSFERFRPDTEEGPILDRVYFITRMGALWGMSSTALSRVRHRVATDTAWEPDDDWYLRRLLEWCRTLGRPVESPDVLRLYASTPARAAQVLLITS